MRRSHEGVLGERIGTGDWHCGDASGCVRRHWRGEPRRLTRLKETGCEIARGRYHLAEPLSDRAAAFLVADLYC